jgi:hypothetical protein
VLDSDATSVNTGRSSELQSEFKAKTSWYLDPEKSKPGSTRWKMERDTVSLYSSCEGDFGRDIRTEFLGDPHPYREASDFDRRARRTHPR